MGSRHARSPKRGIAPHPGARKLPDIHRHDSIDGGHNFLYANIMRPRNLKFDRVTVAAETEVQDQLALVAFAGAGFDLSRQGPVGQMNANLRADR